MKLLQTFLGDRRRVRNFLISYYVIGFLGMALPFTKPIFEQLTGFTIVLSIIFLLLFHVGWNLKFVMISLFIALAGFGVEAFGVKTGWVFGHYSYNFALGPKWLDTPLLIGLNWWMLVYCFYVLLKKSGLKSAFQPVVGALLMLAYDLILEPVAITWNMWHWHQGTVPVHNYLAWFLISLVFFYLLRVTKTHFSNNIAVLMLLLQSGLFVLLNLVRVILYL